MLDEAKGEAAALTSEALLELVADGQRVLGQGRIDEALLLAASVLESDADFVPALALKGDALERKGDFEGALTAYERVLELKPDSALDRIRAAHLRKVASDDALVVADVPPRKQAIWAAGAASILFVVVSATIILASRPDNRDSEVAAKAETQPVVTAFNFAPVPTGPTGSSSPAPTGTSSPSTQGNPQANPTVANPGQGRGEAIVDRPGYVRPSRNTGSRVVDEDQPAAPIIPIAGPGGAINIVPRGSEQAAAVNNPPANPNSNTNGGGGTASQDPDPEVIAESRTGKSQDRTIIEVKSSDKNQPKVGNTEPIDEDVPDKLNADALIQVARQAQVRGDYAKAAGAYEKALRAGASRGSTNQRLAQCYEKLGRKSDAITAYERAIASYQSGLTSGSGDAGRLNASIEACRQAIKNLRGA